MNVRVAYLRRDENSEVKSDGIELSEKWDVLRIPRIGETVMLPEAMLNKVHQYDEITAIMRRFEIVQIDHDWRGFDDAVSIYVSTLKPSHAALKSADRRNGVTG